MLKALSYLLIIVVFGIIVVYFVGRIFFGNTIQEDLTRAQSRLSSIEYIEKNEVKNLPSPVKKYLEYSGILKLDDKPSSFRADFEGEYTTEHGNDPYNATAQLYSTLMPFRLFYAQIQPIPFFELTSKEMYRNKIGSHIIKLLSIVNINDARGKSMNKSQLGAYLSELPFNPAMALINKKVKWKYVDEFSATAFIFDGDLSTFGTFVFRKNGSIKSFSSTQRFRFDKQNKFHRTAWEIEFFDEFVVDGIKIPARYKASWKLPGAEFVYADFKLTSFDFNNLGLY